MVFEKEKRLYCVESMFSELLDFWFCPSMRILINKSYSVPETESVFFLRLGEEDTYSVGFLGKN
jgi:hypothetical protein